MSEPESKLLSPEELETRVARLRRSFASFGNEFAGLLDLALAEIENHIAAREAQLTAAQHEVAEMDAALRVRIPEIEARMASTCVWCGTPAPDPTSTEAMRAHVVEHVKVCVGHPMRALEADNAALLDVLGDVEAELPAIADHKSNPGSTIGALTQLHARLCEARLKPRPGAALLEEHRKALEAKDATIQGMARRMERAAAHAQNLTPDTMAGVVVSLLTSEVSELTLAEAHRKALEPLQAVATGLAEEMEAAIRERERPKGGQSVPFHGDFAQAPPSMVGRLRWWARELRAALGGVPARLLVRARNEGLEKAATAYDEAAKAAPDETVALRIRANAAVLRAMKGPEE